MLKELKRNLTMDSSFHICGTNVEDIDHVLRCSVTILCRNSLVNNGKLAKFYNLSIEDWIVRNLTGSWYFSSSIKNGDIFFVCWLLWKRRNAYIFTPDCVDNDGFIILA